MMLQRPFALSHRRDDGLAAMLLSLSDGEALYRVRWFEDGRRYDNTLVRPEHIFRERFTQVQSA